jgi:hypothetical protein
MYYLYIEKATSKFYTWTADELHRVMVKFISDEAFNKAYIECGVTLCRIDRKCEEGVIC